MSYAAVDASGGGDFLPQHSPTGDFGTLKGRALAPWELDVLQSSAMGDSRHIDEAPSIDWAGTIIVNTGMTRGSGTSG